jgi:D-3-phosphoglycerate dehydrogenase
VAHRVLVTDSVDPEGLAVLRAVESFDVEEIPTLPTAELIAQIGDYDAFVGRSASRLSADVLRAAKRLKVVGRAGVGVDNIALDVATEMGIAVINAPAGNTIAVAELVFGVLIGLLRHVPRADQSMHAGAWEREALMGTELRGKTLGIVGVGRIGSEVARRADAFEMPLIGYDPYIGDEHFELLDITRVASLEELLKRADIVTVHTPLTDETRGMIGATELAAMKRGAVVLNLARGGIVDEEALAAACRSGQIGGAALDAFSKEPLTGDHRFCDVPNLLLTPHLGASTIEAQRNVAIDVCIAVRDALLEGELSRSINVAGAGTNWRELQSALVLARRSAAVARAWLADRGLRELKSISLRVGPELQHSAAALMSAAAAGALSGVVEQARLNLVNARSLAVGRGIELAVLESGDAPHPRALEVRVCADKEEMRVGGVAMNGAAPRITRIGPFHVDISPRGTLIVLTNRDVPGVIGRVGTLLGDAGVNIAEYHQARLQQGGDALAMISVDGDVGELSKKRLLSLPDVTFATTVTFNDGM